MPGSPAEAAGLQVGDLLKELDGDAIDTIQDFQAVLASHEPGDRVHVVFIRDGGSRETDVVLTERKR